MTAICKLEELIRIDVCWFKCIFH